MPTRTAIIVQQDCIGNRVEIGDIVCFAHMNGASQAIGRVVGLSEKTLRVRPIDEWQVFKRPLLPGVGEGRSVRKRPDQVVLVAADMRATDDIEVWRHFERQRQW